MIKWFCLNFLGLLSDQLHYYFIVGWLDIGILFITSYVELFFRCIVSVKFWAGSGLRKGFIDHVWWRDTHTSVIPLRVMVYGTSGRVVAGTDRITWLLWLTWLFDWLLLLWTELRKLLEQNFLYFKQRLKGILPNNRRTIYIVLCSV